MHTHLTFAFKWALDFNTLEIKLFQNSTKLFYVIIINATL